MKKVSISEKQDDFLTDIFVKGNYCKINLLEGSVRSGKTWISLIAFAIFVAQSPKDAQFLMVGKTVTTLKRNCLVLLQELEPSFKFSTNAKTAKLFGRQIWLEGANDDSAEGKIRGMTLTGAYVDELTLIPQGFYNMLLGRLSEPGAMLFATTNPDSPNHYVYTDIILNNEINRKVTKFYIRDNPFLDPDYINELEREYTGVFYQRYFLGEWVLAEGLVYPMFGDSCKASADFENPYEKYCISMDYGIQNPTAMLLWGLRDGVWYCIKEYYHSGRATNIQKTDEEYYDELCKLSDAAITNERIDVIVDPSAASFIALCRQKGRFRVIGAKNEVLPGIQHVASSLSIGMIKVCDNCKATIKEFGLYSWDDKSTEDRVIKENDHAMDALRYFVQTKRIYRDINKPEKPYKPIF